MNHRDVWLVGLLALAYLYLDAAAPRDRARTPLAATPYPPSENDLLAALPAYAPDACPRDLSHSVSLRADGAMWCLGCDEGFFPAEMVL